MNTNGNRIILLSCMILIQIIILPTFQTIDISSNQTIDIGNVHRVVRGAANASKLEIHLVVDCRGFTSKVQLRLPARNKDIASLGKKINLQKRAVFLIHGFNSNSRAGWLKQLTKAYLKRADVNIFIFDWGYVAKNLKYDDAVGQADMVAKEMSNFIKLLITNGKAKASKMHVIGYSLGGQIAGFVGKHTPGVDRITALDPAASKFAGGSPRLSTKDAAHVDVIHTSTVHGLPDRLGHLDFYVNGGVNQPGCANTTNKNFCDHTRAVVYFIESIKNPKCLFVASKTAKRANEVRSKDFDPKEDNVLGLDSFKYKTRGALHVTTNDKSPHCRM